MASDTKQPRGRPPGTGKNEDMGYLAKVADLLARDPDMKPTTAMHRLLAAWPGKETTITLLRRWQRKWRASQIELLAAAEVRLRAQNERTVAEAQNTHRQRDEKWGPGIAEALSMHIPESFARMRGVPLPPLLDPKHPIHRQLAEASAMFNSPSAKAAMAHFESSETQQALKWARQFQDENRRWAAFSGNPATVVVKR